MNFNLYVGGVEHAFSPIGACAFDPDLAQEFNAMPELPLLPLFNNTKQIQSLYSNDGFVFTEDRFHVFSVVCSKAKSEHAIGTTLLIALVPNHLTKGGKSETSKFQGKLKAYGMERLATLHSTNIKLSINTNSNTQFLTQLLKLIKKHNDKISKVLDKRKVMFDMVAIDPKTAKPSLSIDDKPGVRLIYNYEGQQRELTTEPQILGVGHFLQKNVVLKCEEDSTRELLALPTFFLEQHPVFERYHEMIWGIDKPNADKEREQ